MANMQQMVDETAENKELKTQKKRVSIPKDQRDAVNAAVEKAGKDADRKIEASAKALKKEFGKDISELTKAHRELSDEYHLSVINADLKAGVNKAGLTELSDKVKALGFDVETLKADNGKDGLIARLKAENTALATFAGVCTGISIVIVAFLIAGRLF